ncbi:hypothetical protein [Alkalilimnicola sp. S0819]|uniref:hypothetical protein n=1 Tax=Alkalilimnicola sp. S0819 TaxID=2613922 RepID=UPI001261ADA7|nr:hypothetical protein [Alkalilimnicola sp. S0819]KAB7627582.1 hypothetical protein F3N43_03760 [Alkalilimnicola sp. S0819]MPQ15743.1 hypothetical protein [Alkalilimnicola sp. S0819]
MQQPPVFVRLRGAQHSDIYPRRDDTRPALRLSRDAACRVAHTGGRLQKPASPPARLEQLGLSVAHLLEQLLHLRDWESLRRRFPGLEPDDVREALDYAACHGLAGVTG